MKRRTYRITTLGCRSNFAEARELESVLRARGLRRAGGDEPADLEVIHSCSVTHRAAATSRNAVRRAIRRQARLATTTPLASLGSHRHSRDSADQPSGWGPNVLVTGCYAATHREEAAGITGDDRRILPHDADDGRSLLERFAAHVDAWLSRRPAHPSIRSGSPGSSSRGVIRLPVVEPAAGAGAHVRAELRIQDGCDAHCTFCIIPRIRRTLRSKDVADTVGEARRLVELGHKEIVLTGICTGAYGHETALRRRQGSRTAEPLADLLDAVARVPGLQRLRISSMEPGEVTAPLLDAMRANQPVVVPHLHLPLQSGSDRILRMMNRQYEAGAYLEMIDRVNGALTTETGLPPAITTDIICGFPGETEEDFEQTVEMARRVGYLHMHVFPFSARRGTAAARWTDRFVDSATKTTRVRRLIALEANPEHGLSITYRRRLVGRTVRVILEQPDRDNPAVMRGRCDHYALIDVPTRLPRGNLVNVRVAEAGATRTRGELASAGVASARSR